MKNSVDARGLSCPQPVILAKEAIKRNHFPIEILVDSVTARENVRRISEKSGCTVKIEDKGGEFILLLAKE